jgi:hypothetical protein
VRYSQNFCNNSVDLNSLKIKDIFNKLKNQLKNFSFIVIIIVLIVLPHYLSESNLNQFINFTNKPHSNEISKQNFLFNASIYPLFLAQFQIGIIHSILFVIAIFYFFRSKKINNFELDILLLIFQIYLFFSLLNLKNSLVTAMLIPLILIFISGFIIKIKNKKLRLFILLITLIIPILIISPISLNDEFNTIISYNSENYLENPFFYLNQMDYKLINKDLSLTITYDLLKYNKKKFVINNIFDKIIYNTNKSSVYILDLSTIYHHEIVYYNLFLDKNIFCIASDFVVKNDYNLSNKEIFDKYDFILLSENNYSSFRYPSPTKKITNRLNELRAEVLETNSFKLASHYINLPHNEFDHLYLYVKNYS